MRAGDRVELERTTDQWTRLRPGARGTVERISEQLGETVIDVRWDDGSTLSVIPSAGDRVRLVEERCADLRALMDLADGYARIGADPRGQLRAVVDGEPLQDQNVNALRIAGDWLRQVDSAGLIGEDDESDFADLLDGITAYVEGARE